MSEGVFQVMTSDAIPEGSVVFIGAIADYIRDSGIRSVDELVRMLKEHPEDVRQLVVRVDNLDDTAVPQDEK